MVQHMQISQPDAVHKQIEELKHTIVSVDGENQLIRLNIPL